MAEKGASKNLSETSEINLRLLTYEDIFSDFDPRSYRQKALSIDFLEEIKRASRDKEEKIELNLMVARKQRNIHEEFLIKKRLKEHFRKHFNQLRKERIDTIKNGVTFVIAGIITMVIASFILYHYPNLTLLLSFFIVVLEPAGWFLFWEGLNLIIFESKTKRPDYVFYEKMTMCEISFRDNHRLD